MSKRVKKYLLISLIIIILINITSIDATENNTNSLEITNDNTIEIDENTLNSQHIEEDNLSQNFNNQTYDNLLSQSQNDEILSNFMPYNPEIAITVNDTSSFEDTGNITINMHFSFVTPYSDGEFSTYNIHIYENNTLIKKINIGDLNLPEVKPGVTYTADVPFTYTLNPNSYLTTSLFDTYSNILHFEEIKNNTVIKSLNNTQILIDNTFSSNQSWNNSVKSLQKAIDLAVNGGTITLTDINLLQDTIETIQINKNITITGNNASFILDKTQTLLEIQSNTSITLINLTFIGNNNYIISNKGNLKLINCTFKDNSLGLIDNTGELELENCKIEDLNQFYQTRPSNINGLITNTKTLKITNTTFTNNKYTPYNLPTETTTLNGIIYNKGTLYIENVNFTNINYRIIYNDGKSSLNNTLFEDITSTSTQALYLISTQQTLNNKYTYNNYKTQSTTKKTNGGAIYNTKELTIINSAFNNIIGNDGGGIYNTNNLKIINSTFHTITGDNGGAIYNTNQLTIENSIFNNSQTSGSINDIRNGSSIYTTGTCNINNSTITKSKTFKGLGGIYNDGTLTINNTIISKCNGNFYVGGVGIHNNGIMVINNSQILNNNAPYSYLVYRYVRQPTGEIWTYYSHIYAGVISNSETGKATITKTIIKDNTIDWGDSGTGWKRYYGIIKNDGEMEITSCIFDNNNPIWNSLFAGDGSFNIYNTGKITVMYCYLLNTKIYLDQKDPSGALGGLHSPKSFLYDAGTRNCNINYNYYCLDHNDSVQNVDFNYYFTVAFEQEYYPIKLNQTQNITLTLVLTNGQDTIVFNDWDKLPYKLGFNTTITTINENGEWINITTTLYDKKTFNFNYTNIKNEYNITATILGYDKHVSLVDVGKEFANLTVEYNNITYKDGEIKFKMNVSGDYGTPTGNITLTFNNQNYILTLDNGTCNFTLPSNLKPGNYTVKISYNGDNTYFKLLNNIYQCTVYKIKTNITVVAPEVRYGEKGKITITITPDDAKLYGKLYVNGAYVHEADTQSTRTLTITRNVGVYNITVIFDEDEYYESGSASTLFVVSKWKTNLTLTSKNINEGEGVAILNLTINPGDVRGEAIICINGVNSTIFINNTVTPITITDLHDGIYTVSVFYPGDKKYAPSNATTTFSVYRKHTNLTVTISNNDDLTGNVIVKTDYMDCTGEVGVYINNDEVIIKNLTNGSCNFNVKFKRGTNYIYVLYLGDNYYSYVSWNTTKHIEGKAIINTTQPIITEQELNYYIIKLFDTDNNPYEYTNITVLFKNETINLTTDENGVARLPVTSKAGKYNITVIYKNTTYTDTVTVNPAKINIDIKDILAGEIEIITATLPEGASGNVTLIVDNNIINESSSIIIPDLAAGEHDLTVIYTGDDNYINQTINMKFSIKNAISQTRISTSNITYGESFSVIAFVTNGASGSVTFTLNNQSQTISLTGNQANAVFSNVPAGDYILTAKYNGDKIYQGSNTTVNVNVKKATPTITIKTTPLVLNTNIQIDAVLNGDATGNVTFRIQGQYSPRNRTIVNGNASWLISPLNTGSYNLIVIYNGDNNYESKAVSEILILNQVQSVLKVSIANVNAADDLIVTATLSDVNNHKVSGDLVLEINGNYYRIIITDGVGSRNLGEFKVGSYTYTATYQGSDLLSMAIASGSFNVLNNNYKITGNKNIVQYYGANKEYKLQVLNNNVPVKNSIVTISINKNSVKVKTDSQGYATLKLSLKAGKYTITSTYKNAKVSNKITVKPTLITKNKKIKKGKTLTYTAKLLNKNGKKQKNKKITFKINGKKYNAKTNKKGIAKIKVKNLKKGKYKIKTSYGNLKNTNTITVK